MQSIKTIISQLLLAIYLLIVLHQSAAHSHIDVAIQPIAHQQESDLKTAHHHHHFHGGLFHFLGHLFENINHADDFADEHLVSVQNLSSKKNIGSNTFPVNSPAFLQNAIILDVNSDSLSGPPVFYTLPAKAFIPLSCPLRAPPVTV